MAPPERRDAFLWARGFGGFTILYDLRFSSDTQMWKEEIARHGAPRCLGPLRVLFVNREDALRSMLHYDHAIPRYYNYAIRQSIVVKTGRRFEPR